MNKSATFAVRDFLIFTHVKQKAETECCDGQRNGYISVI
jgi:hypothetical protein